MERVGPFRVCLAEDDRGLRKLLATMLETLGHEVVCAVEHGEALVEHVAHTHPDLVLVDLEMPVLDGLAAAEEIAQSGRVPVVLISGHSDLDRIVLDKEPVVFCLRKPVSLEVLEATIKQVMAIERNGASS